MIKISIIAPGMALQAQLKDESLSHLLKLAQDFREEPIAPGESTPIIDDAVGPSIPQTDENVKNWLRSQGAAELLTRVGWNSYPEKILLLGAWHEAQGGTMPWRSSDMDSVFSQAKEKPPGNFPRDIRQSIKSGWVHAATPRTYNITGTGWRKLGEELQRLQAP